MTQAKKQNVPWVWPALLLTLAATAWAAFSEDPATELATPRVEQSRPRPPRIKENHGTGPAVLPQFTPRAAIEYEPEDLFPGDVPPQEETELEPVKPTTPALPFTYAGKLIDNDQTVVFMQHEGRALALKAGDIVGNDWRIESVSGSTLLFSYLPLGTVVPLTIGVSN
jgi:hypothetical protein